VSESLDPFQEAASLMSLLLSKDISKDEIIYGLFWHCYRGDLRRKQSNLCYKEVHLRALA
jgi:hypothetical protein